MKVWHALYISQIKSTKSENQRCLMAEIISFEVTEVTEKLTSYLLHSVARIHKNYVDFKSNW